MKRVLLFLLCCFTLLQAAEYRVVVKGHNAGDAKLSMTENKNTYRVSLTLLPNGLAKLLGISDMEDVSKGYIQAGHYFPQTYQRHTLKGKHLFSVDFSGSQAKQNHKGQTKKVTVNPKGQDPLAQIAQIRHDLQHNQMSLQYYLITEKSQQLYHASMQTTATGRKVILTQSPKPDRIVRLWFDKDWQLQRMQKEKRGKIDFDMNRK